MFCTKHESSCVKFNEQIFDWMYQSSSGNETKHVYYYMNSKIRNALLIIMNDRSFECSANSVRVIYTSACLLITGTWRFINLCSYTVVAYHGYCKENKKLK